MKKNNALLNPNLEAVTQRIHSLEQKLDITLFIRTRSDMQLTAEGEKLRRYCITIADYSNETLTEMMNAGINLIQRVKIAGPSILKSERITPEKYYLVCTNKWKSRDLKEILRTERIIDFDETDQATYHYLSKFNLVEIVNSII